MITHYQNQTLPVLMCFAEVSVLVHLVFVEVLVRLPLVFWGGG
jgi:hypothetical protein